MKKAVCILLFASHFLVLTCSAQHYTRTDTIPVKENGNWLKNAWAGGHNFCQFSDIDMNMDGIKDLFVFDRSGNKVTTYINGGTPNTIDYKHAPQYQSMFPHMECWALMVDYNCDGKEDIFTFNYGIPSSATVYKNISTSSVLQFTLVKQFLVSNYNPPAVNPIYLSSVGLPAFEDIDGDGDIDVLMFLTGGWTLDYHINKSVEMGYGCDSLIFYHDPCWGNFTETSSNCSATLGTPCKTGNYVAPPDSLLFAEDNGGSCLLCLDMDGDSDKELYLGQLGCCTGSLLTNGGSPSAANMTSVDTLFPDSATRINMYSFPCGYFVDVNNDNKRDLIVNASMANAALNDDNIWYYENTGADNAPVFLRKNKKLLNEDMIDAGEGAHPAFFDFDSDGLTDLLVSNYDNLHDSCPYVYDYKVRAYKNIGTASSPEFDLVSTDFASLSTLAPLAGKHLTFGDMDNDLDLDMMIGDYDGKINYFNNTAGAGNPAVFVIGQMGYPDTTGLPMDIGSYSTPQLIDADRDGDLDLVVGERAGNLNYYQNIGTVVVPSFAFMSDSFGGVDMQKPCCTGYSVPFMYDSAGSYRMLVGSEANRSNGMQVGWIAHYKNIDGNLAGKFSLVDSMVQNIWEGVRMAIDGKDITNDGFMDLVIGNYCGGLAFYLGDSLTTGINELGAGDFNFNIYPNPTNGQFVVSGLQFPVQINIYNSMGQLVLVKSTNRKEEIINLDEERGIYFCNVRGKDFSKTKKLVLVK